MILIVLICSAYSIGTLTLRRMRTSFSGPMESSVYSIGIGLGMWCYLLFLLGHLGLLYPWLLLTIAILSVIPTGLSISKNVSFPSIKLPKIKLTYFDRGIALMALFILGVTFICCFSPVVGGISNDEIATHLSVPKEWLALHKISALPDPSSAIAGHIELLFLWVMAFAPEQGPKLFTWVCLLFCLALVYCFAKQTLGKKPALYACIFIIINPLVFRAACTAFIDIPSTFFLLAALGTLWRMKETKNIRFLGIAAFFIGVGCGAKPTIYFYLPAFFIISAWALFALNKRGRTLAKLLAALAVLVCLFAAPWPARNMILSGSPTFPPPLFLYELRGNKPFVFSGEPYTKKAAIAMYAYYHSRIQQHGIGIKNFFLLPWNITMHPESLSIGDSVGTVMLSLLPLVFFFRKRPPWICALLVFCGIAASCIYFLIIPEARYFIAIFMVLSVVFAWLLKTLEGAPGLLVLVKIIILCNCAFSCAVAARKFNEEIRAALFQDYRKTFCQKNTPFYEAFEYCNRKKPKNLFVFYDNQVFYYLKTAYHCNGKILTQRPLPANTYILDIDYSQTLDRNLAIKSDTYCIGSPSPYLSLVFKGPDARIYQVTGEEIP